MKDEIKEILDKPKILMLSYGNYISLDDYVKLKDYITNLQEEINLQEYNYQIMQEDITEVGKLLGLRDDFIISEEMPEKIKELQQENERLKEENKRIFSHVNDEELLISNAMNYVELQDYKSRCEKASELIHDIYFRIDFNNLCHPTWVGIKLDETSQGNDLLNILQGSDKE